MDYQKHYALLIETRQSLQEQRKIDRKKNLKYYEAHHIIPKSEGGSDDMSNMILLTFKEHFFAHLLRFKDSVLKQDSVAIKQSYATLMLMSSFAPKSKRHINSSKTYEYYKNKYWSEYKPEYHNMFNKSHTPEARKSISEARKGMMPVKDANTGGMIGSVSINHPKVLSGEWVHHTKGRIASNAERERVSKATKGERNPNFKGSVTAKFILDTLRNHYETCTYGGYLHFSEFGKFLKSAAKEDFGYNIDPSCMVKNRFGSKSSMLNSFNSLNNMKLLYDPKHRGFPKNKNQPTYYWFSNDATKTTTRAKDINDLDISLEWYRGRKYK